MILAGLPLPERPRNLDAAHDRGCGVDECGNRRCESCDERLLCTGPEPALTCEGHTFCTDCDSANRCMWCKAVRAEA